MNSATIGDRIKFLRATAGMTQSELSKIINAKRQTIAQWEHNEREPKAKHIYAISKYFGVSGDYLLGVTDVMTKIDNNAAELQKVQTAYGHKEGVLTNGTKVEISITMQTTNAHPKDRKEIFEFFKEYAASFHTVIIPGITGTVQSKQIEIKPSAATDGNSAEELKALVSKSIHDTIQDIQRKS